LRRELGPLASALLLGLFIISVGSLVASLRLIDLSKLSTVSGIVQPTAPTVQQSTQLANVAESGAASAWVIIAAVVVVSVVFLIMARKRQSAAGEALFWRLMGVMIAVAIWIGIIEFLRGMTSFVGGAQRQLVVTTSVLSLAAALAVLSAVAALTWLERSRIIHASASLEERRPAQGLQKFLESVRRTIYSTPRSEVYRDSVIACYSAMTGLLAKQGADDRPSFTPRELEATASRKLVFAEADVHLLTQLFEKARYADAAITKREAQDSVDALDRMASEVAAKDPRVGVA